MDVFSGFFDEQKIKKNSFYFKISLKSLLLTKPAFIWSKITILKYFYYYNNCFLFEYIVKCYLFLWFQSCIYIIIPCHMILQKSF